MVGSSLVGLGPTLANTEANLEENHRALALVTVAETWTGPTWPG